MAITNERLEEIEKRAAAAQSGPWSWEANPKAHRVSLVARGNLVMDFVRWGMGGAQPRLQRFGLMEPASNFAEVVPGREHHAEWFRVVRHPDADFIAAARTD